MNLLLQDLRARQIDEETQRKEEETGKRRICYSSVKAKSKEGEFIETPDLTQVRKWEGKVVIPSGY